MKVTITGPNVHGGIFHVHRTECADLNKRPYSLLTGRYAERYIEDHNSIQSVVESVYSDFITMNDCDPWESFVDEFHFFPCTDSLPYHSPIN